MTIDECFEEAAELAYRARNASVPPATGEKLCRIADVYLRIAELKILQANPVAFRKQGPI